MERHLPSPPVRAWQVLVGKPLCSIDGDEASVVKSRIQAAQDEEDANAPPPEVGC